MTYREPAVPGAWEITPTQHGDPRGVFLEAFQGGPFAEATGHRFDLQQANISVSAAGVLRGIHFAGGPPGQAKYVTCPEGAGLVVVDER
uniref:dTDP-4-dehydrorhamnose 3,5-epimerase family protein n=1 Tax=Cellulomonas sp. GbtcB1 TaxID=2824746 RepID=UPI001C2FE945